MTIFKRSNIFQNKDLIL